MHRSRPRRAVGKAARPCRSRCVDRLSLRSRGGQTIGRPDHQTLRQRNAQVRRWASRPAQTLMILSSAALVGAYWERLRVLPLEQRRVARREPPSEQRSAGQPAYLGESLVPLHRHRAPITATRPTDIPLTGSRAMDIRATRGTPPPPVLRAMDTQATQDSPLTPPLRAMDTQATRDTLPTPVPPMDTRAARHTPPIPVLVMEIRSLLIPVIALRRTGRLEPSTVSSLLAS